MSDADLVEDAVHGGNERYRDKADDATHRDDDDRLEKGRQPIDLVSQLSLVVRSRDLELGVERAGFFADPDHLRGRRGEQAGLPKGLSQTLATEHRLTDARQGSHENAIAQGFGGNPQR